jgi:hypothetical protein
VDPVPDPLHLRKSGSGGNLNRDLWICSQELCTEAVKSRLTVPRITGHCNGDWSVFVWFDVLSSAVVKVSMFWDISWCCLLRANRRLAGKFRLHLHCMCYRQLCFLPATCWFLTWLILHPQNGGHARMSFNILHGIMSRKILKHISFHCRLLLLSWSSNNASSSIIHTRRRALYPFYGPVYISSYVFSQAVFKYLL